MIKSRFRGRSEHALDGKGRLNFPSRFREVLTQYDSDVLMVAPWGRTHLRAFPVPEWEMLENKLMTEGLEQTGLSRLIRYIVGGVHECSIDKQGRVLVPQSLRNEVSLQKDIMLVGMLAHVEIWDMETWRLENQATSENFDGFEEQFAKMGIF